ncbi:MAG: cupin fold metalloprotein, WbuC family [Acidimicrobiia bacterium]|nr:cupin fold metalloprotein, WbuC family [Acidimicrobiia bacterium]
MPAVTYLRDRSLIEVTPGMVAQLKADAAKESLRRARLCLHPDPGHSLHEMIIAFTRDTYVRPHRHRNKCESMHVIEGELDVVFFDDAGCESTRIKLGPFGSGKAFYYRLTNMQWHSVVLHTDTAVIHETTNGPFNAADSEFAPWSPEPTDLAAAAAFTRRLLR